MNTVNVTIHSLGVPRMGHIISTCLYIVMGVSGHIVANVYL